MTYTEAVTALSILSRNGLNAASLSTESYLNLHWFKINAGKKVAEVDEALVLLAKDTGHEIVQMGQSMVFQHATMKGDKKEYSNPSDDFLAKKKGLEETVINVKTNFLKLEEFRTYVGSVEGQFDLIPFLVDLSEEAKKEPKKKRAA